MLRPAARGRRSRCGTHPLTLLPQTTFIVCKNYERRNSSAPTLQTFLLAGIRGIVRTVIVLIIPLRSVILQRQVGYNEWSDRHHCDSCKNAKHHDKASHASTWFLIRRMIHLPISIFSVHYTTNERTIRFSASMIASTSDIVFSGPRLMRIVEPATFSVTRIALRTWEIRLFADIRLSLRHLERECGVRDAAGDGDVFGGCRRGARREECGGEHRNHALYVAQRKYVHPSDFHQVTHFTKFRRQFQDLRPQSEEQFSKAKKSAKPPPNHVHAVLDIIVHEVKLLFREPVMLRQHLQAAVACIKQICKYLVLAGHVLCSAPVIVYASLI